MMETITKHKTNFMRTVMMLLVCVFTSATAWADISYAWADETKTLTISGSGTIADYNSESTDQPWNEYMATVKTIIIEDGVTSIGAYAFYGCTALKSVTIAITANVDPDDPSQYRIGDNAFGGCSSLTSVTMPFYSKSEDETIFSTAFSECTALTTLTLTGPIVYYGSETSTVDGDNVFYSGAFSGLTDLSLIIGDGITEIDASAFADYGQIKSITIGSSVESIGEGAFSGCTGLTEVTIGSGVTSIGGWAFSGCTGLTSVTIPDNVETIGDGAFSGCWDYDNETGLTEVTIGSGVTSIGYGAFSGCTGVTDVYLYAGPNNFGWTDISSEFNGGSEAVTFHVNSDAVEDFEAFFAGLFADLAIEDYSDYIKIEGDLDLPVQGDKLGCISYTQGTDDGGTLTFYIDANCTDAITITDGESDAIDSNDLTDGIVYIKAQPDNLHLLGADGSFITVSDNINVSTTTTAGVYSFTMPDDGSDVTVSASFPDKPYLDGTTGHEHINYIIADGSTVNTGSQGHAKVYVLDGTETTLGIANAETWYVVKSNLSTLPSLEGDVHLILSYGKTLSPFSIMGNNHDLTVYGEPIPANGTVENIGKFNAMFGFNSFKNFTVNSGSVFTQISIKATNATINGGIVEAQGEITADYINLGWNNADIDNIFAGGYNSDNVTMNNRFLAYDYDFQSPNSMQRDKPKALYATGDKPTAPNLNGVKLLPLNSYTVAIADNYITVMDGNTAKEPDFSIGNTPYYLYDTNATVTLGYNREGYSCTYKVNNTGIQGNTFTMPANDVTVTATFTLNNYTITYENAVNNQNNVTNTNPTSYTYESADITLADASRTGYAFGGWFTDAGLNNKVTGVAISSGSQGAKTFYAKWTPIKYFVRFNKNNDNVSSGEMSNQEFTYDVAQALTANAFSQTYYEFMGWSTTADGEVTYTDGQSVSNLVSTHNTVVDLYAQWKHVLVLASDEDNSTIIQDLNGELFDEVTLDGRTFYLYDTWNTLYLPFNLGNANATDGHHFDGTPLQGATVKTYADTEYDDGTLTMNFTDATSIEAGKPYAVKWDADLVIRTTADWNAFAASVNNGSGNTYAGKLVRLAADITISTMVGTGTEYNPDPNHYFSGTFDGCGHTLTLDITTTGNGRAPFRYVVDGTIQNLTIAGKLKNTDGRENAGLVAFSRGTVTISNCVVSATIEHTKVSSGFGTGNAANGGFVSCEVNGLLTLNNCLFSGKLLGTSAKYSGGFVGWRNGSPDIAFNNCLFAPAQVTMGNTGSSTWFRGGSGHNTITNCYYTQTFSGGSGNTNKTGSALQALLGDGWEVSGNNVVPKMSSNIENPVFTNVTISNLAVLGDNNTFIGSYKPFSDDNLLFDAHNPDGDALHAALDITLIPNDVPTGYAFGGWCADVERTAAATAIPFAADGSVTLYAKYTPILSTPNEWMTWCSDENYEVPIGCKVYEVTGIDGTTVTLNELTTLPAYTPVLIKCSEEILVEENYVAQLPFISVGTAPDSWFNNRNGLVATSVTDCSFIGNATGTKISNGNYYSPGKSYGLYNGSFFLIDSNQGIPAHRCILTLAEANGARMLTIGEEENRPTPVPSLYGGEWNDSWYTIDGRKLSGKPSRAGIYIVNGKKIMVK